MKLSACIMRNLVTNTTIAAFALSLSMLLGETAKASESFNTSFESSEGYVVGQTLFGQQGWDGGGAWTPENQSGFNKIFSGEMATDTVSRTGGNSWYFPGGPTTQGTGTPFSPALGVTVGAPGTGADYSMMTTTLWLKAANPEGDDSTMNIYQGYNQGRYGFNINFSATASGINFWTFVWEDGTYVSKDIGTVADLSAWHSIDVVSTFTDTPENDVMTYIINKGTPEEIYFTANTWITPWYEENRDYEPVVDRLKFTWVSGPAAGEGGGFYFDDISYAAIPEPASLALLGLGGLLTLARRRRKAWID